MLAGLDPHSSYMDPKSFRDMQVQTRGEFGGLGIEVTMEDGLLKVVAPIDETPAAKAGIMANDIITHLDDEPVRGLALDQAVEKMRGPENSKIKLKIVRKGQDKPIEVSITRARIQVRSVRSRLEGDDVGFIRVTQFNEQTTENLKKAIRGEIIDTQPHRRGNPAVQCARGRPHDRPVIVLINVGSASASEIVAGAPGSPARDRHRHALVRQRLGADHHSARHWQWGAPADHRALLHPSGRSIQAKGISPTLRCCRRCPRSSKHAPTRVARLRCADT